MHQSKLESWMEVASNIVIGFTINYWANMVILPMYGMTLTYATNFQIGLLYTVIAIIRSYALRRWFNAGIKNRIHQLSGFFSKDPL